MKFNLNSELRNDLKMIACREKHGLRGYGIYINIIALMYEQENNTLPLDFHLLALEMREDEKVVQSVIMDFKLFRIVLSKNEFFSVEVGKELDRKKEISDKRKTNVNKRWEKEKKHYPPTLPVRTNERAQVPELQAEKSEQTAEPAPMAMQEPAKEMPKLSHEEAKMIVAEALSSPPLNDFSKIELEQIDSICYYFYGLKCIYNAAEETMRFWNYWAASNWQQKNGKFITDKLAAAKAWKINEPRTIPKIAVNFAHALLSVAMNLKIPYIQFVSQIYDIEVTTGKIILTASPKIIKIIEDNLEPIASEMSMTYKGKRLEYKVKPQEADEALVILGKPNPKTDNPPD